MTSKNESAKLAELISKALDFLKNDRKVSNKQVEKDINLGQLAKAKNSKYQVLNRQDILETLLSFYNLKINETSNEIMEQPESGNNTDYYMVYYFLKERQVVKMGIMKVKNWSIVETFFYNADYSKAEVLWKGSYRVIESNTFIDLEKKGVNVSEVTPIKTLMCLYSGTEKINRPYLIGTYSAVRKNNIPTCGKVFMEKVDSFEVATENLTKDIDPVIVAFLNETNIIGETITPDKLSDLPVSHIISKFIGKYKVFFPGTNGELREGAATMNDYNVVYFLLDGKEMEGRVTLLSVNSIRLVLRVKDVQGHLLEIDSTIIVNEVNGLLTGISLSTGYDGFAIAQPVLIFKEGSKFETENVKLFFESFPHVSLSGKKDVGKYFTTGK